MSYHICIASHEVHQFIVIREVQAGAGTNGAFVFIHVLEQICGGFGILNAKPDFTNMRF